MSFINDNLSSSFIATGNLDVWVKPLKERIRCRWFTSTALIGVEGLRLQVALDKGKVARAVRNEFGFERLIAIGDGANDIPMFKEATYSVAFGGVHPPTNEAIQNSTHIIHSSGALCKLLKAL